MRDTTRRLEFFSFYDHTGIEAHLERMAERGWLLDKIGSFTWHYRRIEPRKLTFSVCYFPKASQFDPGPSEEQQTFYDFCAHTGWTLAAASAQMQIFYNERENPVPIDTDPVLEVEAIHQSAKKGFLLSQGLLLAVAALNFGLLLLRQRADPVATLSSPLDLFAGVCWLMILLLIGMDFAAYFTWRRRALRAAERGEFLATRSHPLLQKLVLMVMLVGFAWTMSFLRGGLLPAMAAALLCTVGTVFAAIQIRELLRRKKVPAGTNRATTAAACVVLALLLAALIPALVVTLDGGGAGDSGEPPLSLLELMGRGPADGQYGQETYFSQSPLLAVLTANQSFWPEGTDTFRYLDYTVTEAKVPSLYGICKNQLLGENDTRGTGQFLVKYYVPIDPAPWGAQEAYQFHMEDEDFGVRDIDLYLLCYENRIVKLDPNWELTAAQMSIVGEKLGG